MLPVRRQPGASPREPRDEHAGDVGAAPPPSPEVQRGRLWVPSFLALALFWGCSFAFIRVGLQALSPVQVVFWRMLLGLAALALITST